MTNSSHPLLLMFTAEQNKTATTTADINTSCDHWSQSQHHQSAPPGARSENGYKW